MEFEKIQLKLFLNPERSVDYAAAARVFQHWIRERVLSELLIDVADYGHVQRGPKLLLVGHESDYSFDDAEGRLGLLFFRKHGPKLPPERLHENAYRLLNAAQRLEREPELQGQLQFKTDEWLVRLVDRLNAPNTPQTFAVLRPELEALFAELYGTPPIALEHVQADPRAPLSVRVRLASAPPLAKLLESRR